MEIFRPTHPLNLENSRSKKSFEFSKLLKTHPPPSLEKKHGLKIIFEQFLASWQRIIFSIQNDQTLREGFKKKKKLVDLSTKGLTHPPTPP